jgi:hypothetical protein
MADIQNIGPLPKSTILGFAKGWKIKRGFTMRPITKKSEKMLRIIWKRWLAYSNNSCERNLEEGHLVNSQPCYRR